MTTEQKIIRAKLGLLELAKQLGNVSQACNDDRLPLLAADLVRRKVKVIAVGATRRMALLPEVPTVAESGLPGYEAVSWFGLPARHAGRRRGQDQRRGAQGLRRSRHQEGFPGAAVFRIDRRLARAG